MKTRKHFQSGQALAWSLSARHILKINLVFSPNQLLFGHNDNPFLALADKVSALNISPVQK